MTGMGQVKPKGRGCLDRGVGLTKKNYAFQRGGSACVNRVLLSLSLAIIA